MTSVDFLKDHIFCPNLLNWLMKWVLWLWFYIDKIALKLSNFVASYYLILLCMPNYDELCQNLEMVIFFMKG